MSRKFENLECYQRSAVLAAELLRFTNQIKMNRIASQISASAISIPSNIAEGSQYKSEADFRRFLHYALGSGAEVIAQLYVLKLMNQLDFPHDEWKERIVEIQKMISGLIRSLSSKQ